jgi:hypothetical protein
VLEVEGADLEVDEGLVRRVPGRVRPDHRDHRGGERQQPADRLAAQEIGEEPRLARLRERQQATFV